MININDFLTIKNASKTNPVYFSDQVLGDEMPWSKQIEIMESVRDNQETNVLSGHGIGKSWTAARTILWFLYSFEPSIVISTAPTQRQIERILWEELRRQHRLSRVTLGGQMLSTQLKLSEGWFAIGLSTDEPTNFQGFHSEHVLVVMDEAGGVPKSIYEATAGLLTGKLSRVLRIGNPTSTASEFYNSCKSGNANVIHVSSLECPNVVENRIIYPRLVTKAWVEARKREWGEDSGIYQSRVLGEWPVEGDDCLVPLSWCERAVTNEVQTNEKSVTLVGVDVARFGGDKTVIMCTRGRKLIDIDSFQGKDLMESCGRAIAMKKKYGAKTIVVDDTGLGGGLTDRLRELKCHVIAINFAQCAKDKELFADIKAEMFWKLREDIRDSRIQIRSGALLAELPTIKYSYTSKGQIRIESKQALKGRGVKSPDHADCLALVNYVRHEYFERSWQYNRGDFEGGGRRDICPDSDDSMSAIWEEEFENSNTF